ncbi:MAG: YicC/YloC family endoribonuclease [Candidatus Zapsychrus exili]|nr:YicC/YloC family endoribonuclease [Candidatus Zapsychrus exili]
MIKGMTGYGSSEASAGKTKVTVEIKSVNHRYLDISYYLPIGWSSAESKIKQLLQKDIKRGRITVSIRIMQKLAHTITLNKEVVKQHLKHANSLSREFKLKNDLSLTDIIKLPGVLESKEVLISEASLWPAISQSLKKSLSSLVTMRKREGISLSVDVADKLKRMTAQAKKIKDRATSVLKSQKKKLTIDEFKSFQKSSDINEELSRLGHYISEMKLLIKSKIAVGKKIDFVAQEMQRETNTIGSKLQDKVVSSAVIALKSKIEKIREQAQNIE